MTFKGVLRRLTTTVLGLPNVEEAAMLHRVLGRRRGVLLDVGAHVGTTLMPFAEAGWQVHAFEPDVVNREQLERTSTHLPNVTIVPAAVSDRAGTMTLYRSEESTGISSLVPFTDRHTVGDEVPVVTLASYLSSVRPSEVTLLKVDVEGYERSVLRGFPWEQYLPQAVLVEFEDSKTTLLGYVWTDLAEDLRNRGYDVFVSEWQPIERYGIAHEWHRFFAYPGALSNPQAWGNLMAILPANRRRLAGVLRLTAGSQRLRRLGRHLRPTR